MNLTEQFRKVPLAFQNLEAQFPIEYEHPLGHLKAWS